MQQVCHHGLAETGEDDDPKKNVIYVVRTSEVLSRQIIIILELKEHARMIPRSRKADMGESKEQE